MKRSALFLGLGVVLSSLGGILVTEGEASACGGCVVPPNQASSDITDERMLLSVSPQQTTLYDQIRYAGNPESFAWVLPIQGTVDVGLSADVLFASIDALTTTTIYPPPVSCPGPPSECLNDSLNASAGSSSSGGASPGGVDVLKAENVGPYATVQIRSTDPNALTTWLADNGFQIKPDEKPIVEQYVKEGYDFLALKLKPNEGVNSMRPVRVSMQGASLSLPLRMAAVGTGAKVGITIWVVGEGRYEPKNFPFFQIESGDLTWDFSKNASDYSDLRAKREAQFGGAGWELQSSISLGKSNIQTVIENGGNNGGFGGPNTATKDYLPIEPDGQNPGKTADQVRSEDISDLFAGMPGSNVRVTRLRSDVSKQAMNVDFYLQASADQSEISNLRRLTKYTNLQCPVYNNCGVDGFAPSPEEAAARTAANSSSSSSCSTSKTKSKMRAMDFGIAAAFGGIALVGIGAARRRRKSENKS